MSFGDEQCIHISGAVKAELPGTYAVKVGHTKKLVKRRGGGNTNVRRPPYWNNTKDYFSFGYGSRQKKYILGCTSKNTSFLAEASSKRPPPRQKMQVFFYQINNKAQNVVLQKNMQKVLTASL